MMISISKKKAFNEEYSINHVSSVLDFAKKTNHNINFFKYKFDIKACKTEDLLRVIALDPFSFQNLDDQSSEFLKCYLEIADFLLYSQTYFDIVKSQYKTKKRSEYLASLREERGVVLSKFGSNNIIRMLSLNNSSIINSEVSYNRFYQAVKDIFNKNNIDISKIFDYDKYLNANQSARSSILNNINITVCPYCNRQYIDTYSIEGKIKSIAQIDHFYPKKIFPLYSLSLLNFVPSCSYCNCSIKKDRLFPWNKIYHDDTVKQKVFSVDFNDFNGIYGDQKSFILVMHVQDEHSKKNSAFFRHEHIYKNHMIDISELLKKRILYNNSYKHSLEKCLSEEIKESDFKKLIFGVSGLEDDLTSIPLSKLKNDILDEL
ncbi:hypothetical protein C7431_107227 [Pantoea allii]|uniref:HNH endonuclease n=1 Tax=Pantoea allii TaxID=574096 RepID=A0A2V2BK77_9GAMM|nr:hypothetical protein [Pantoea allii]PWK95825.1 hypothetical protein C7431_107227 [Pantoea allii]